jgi:hypothetical protein
MCGDPKSDDRRWLLDWSAAVDLVAQPPIERGISSGSVEDLIDGFMEALRQHAPAIAAQDNWVSIRMNVDADDTHVPWSMR